MNEDTLSGQRHRYTLGDDNYYINIFGDDDGPTEVWLTVPDENQPLQQKSRSNAQAIAALAQEHLQDGMDALRVVEILEDAVTVMGCEAGMIARALREYMEGI